MIEEYITRADWIEMVETRTLIGGHVITRDITFSVPPLLVQLSNSKQDGRSTHLLGFDLHLVENCAFCYHLLEKLDSINPTWWKENSAL